MQRLKDIAFERAIEGYQVPVFVGGRLMGYRRKTNDALLMFCLRHYGHDSEGRRTTIATYSAAAMAGAGAGSGAGAGAGARAGGGEGGASGAGAGTAVAQASATVRTVTRGRSRGGAAGQARAGDPGTAALEADDGAARQDALAATLDGFAGVTLDATAAAAIAEAVAACARRRRAADAAIAKGGDDAIAQRLDDNGPRLVKVGWLDEQHWGQLEPPYAHDAADAFGDAALYDEVDGSDGTGMDPRFVHELPWSLAGTDLPEVDRDAAKRADTPGGGDAGGEDAHD